MVTLATAHAAKFPETVKQALGRDIGLPERARDFASRPEAFETGPMDADFVRRRIDAIVAKLKEQNIDIARRTVAKYRESLGIPSSVQRRREARVQAAR